MPTTRRYYVNNAPQQQISAQINNAVTSLACPSFAGWPTQFPFFATLELGTASEEIVSVTNISGTTATIVRGLGGTTAITHLAGATFDMTAVAQDYDEANAHTSATAGVHGISGNVVGDSDVQTLSNKTLASPSLTGTASGVNASLSGTLGVTGLSTVAGVNASGAVNANGAGTGLAVANNATVGGTLGITGAATAAQITAILTAKQFTNEAAAGTQPAGTFVYLTAPTGTAFVAGVFESTGSGWLPVGLGAWTSYTPTLVGATTSPTLGTGGSAMGRYTQIGKTVIGAGRILFGTAATAAGSGAYSITLPLPMLAASYTTNAVGVGNGRLKCAGVYTPFHLAFNLSSTQANLEYTSAAVGGTSNFVASAAPGAWTINDFLEFSFIYETN